MIPRCVFALLCLILLTSKCLLALEPTAEPVVNIQKTFSMIKPSAVKDSNIGAIIQIIEKAHLHIVALKMQTITKEEAEAFYAEHKNRSFFPELVSIMTSGPIVAMCVEGENAISHLRQVVGATDPKKAALGTIRALFGKSVGENAIHASDSDTNAAREIAFFFSQEEICQ